MGIIRSILDTDLYKFTTGYAYAKLFPRAYGEFRFIDRNKQHFTAEFAEHVREEIHAMAALSLTREEKDFLQQELPYLPPIYLDFLQGYHFDPDEVSVSIDTDGHLDIRAQGLLYRVTLWETPILAIVSELYYRHIGATPDWTHVERVTRSKGELMRNHKATFSIFGMRRRFSFEVEDRVTSLLKESAGNCLFGTSNVHLAHKHGLRVSGTHPHEWIQFHGAIFGYKMANYVAMEDWINVYDGDLGTVLTDTYTTDVFMRNFSKKHAMLYTSLRHDSGDPAVFIDKAVRRYEELRVDPKIKYIIFSDGLSPEKAVDIQQLCGDRIKASFGIGTNFTNDVGGGVEPLNIVMKLWKCKMTAKDDWHHCVKLSDVGGKHTGDPQEIALAMTTLGIKQE
ncbi:nicotinate phosphoribosyltransferase [Porphyromonas loveana]|uniref:nicotinate phosphoribosyltransferase n=1 Tax=Porphyromonas loveana TaxID=1884669 RepID=UPI00359FE14C